LRDLGFYDVRVRHHELAAPVGNITIVQKAEPSRMEPKALHLARIEVGRSEMPKFLENGVSEKVASGLKEIGYAHITLDLLGYRRGSTNEVIQPAEKKAQHQSR